MKEVRPTPERRPLRSVVPDPVRGGDLRGRDVVERRTPRVLNAIEHDRGKA